MMYHNKLVATIRSRGKILREHGETVHLPFGSEYSVQLKNLDPCRRALVAVDIDGRDVLDGGNLVIEPAQMMNLERFIVGGDLNKGPRFKFIERTDSIENTRGIGMEDGLVEITFRYEEPRKVFKAPEPTWIQPSWPPVYFGDSGPSDPFIGYSHSVGSSLDPVRNAKGGGTTSRLYSSNIADGMATCDTFCSTTLSNQKNDEGITVMGSESKQSFEETVVTGTLSEQYKIIFKLKGDVNKVLGTRDKIVCADCNAKNKSSNRFCGNCGSNLKYAV